MANADPIIPFREFCKREVRNNFELHFNGYPRKDFMGDLHRKGPAFRACMKAHPKKFGTLARQLYGYNEREKRGEKLDLDKLYSAYKMMHPFAASNEEIFK